MSNKNWIEPTILPLVCQWTLKDKHFHYNLGLEKYDQWSLSRPHFDANGRSINQIILSSWISILNWHCFVILHWRWSLMWWRFSSRYAWKRKICIRKMLLGSKLTRKKHERKERKAKLYTEVPGSAEVSQGIANRNIQLGCPTVVLIMHPLRIWRFLPFKQQ